MDSECFFKFTLFKCTNNYNLGGRIQDTQMLEAVQSKVARMPDINYHQIELQMVTKLAGFLVALSHENIVITLAENLEQ